MLAEAGWKIRIIAGKGKEFHESIPIHIIPEINSRHQTTLEIGKSLAAGLVSKEFFKYRDNLVEKLCTEFSDVDACIVHNVHTLHKNLPLTAALHELLNINGTCQIAWCHDFAWHDKNYRHQLHQGYPWDLLRTAWPGVIYVTVSKHRRNRLSDLMTLPIDDILVIPPGIPFADFLKLEPLTRSIIDRLNLMNSNPIVLLPARITRRKNIEFAIQVIASMRGVFPEIALLITGPPGPHNPENIAYLDSLRKLKNNLGVTKNVHFLYELGVNGEPLELTDQVVADLYRLADVLLFPSTREGFGIPILEAGIARIPVFAADIPSVRESSKGFTNLFASSDEPKDVGQEVINKLKLDQAHQLKHAVLAEFTWEAIIKNQVIPLINSIPN
jgi:glycosyltransferase involved in cell wall biosynthesis